MIRLNRIFGRKSEGDPGLPADQSPDIPSVEDPTFALRLRRAAAAADDAGPLTETAAHAAPRTVQPPPRLNCDPDKSGVDWDEDLADDYLASQESGLAQLDPAQANWSDVAVPRQKALDVAPEMPADRTTLALPADERAAMAQRQLAAAQKSGHLSPEPTAHVDLSNADMPDAGRVGRRAGRVKTRLLGFDPTQGLTNDPIEAVRQAAPAQQDRFPAGWIVVVRGPGRGAFFPIFNGVSQIGRGDDQAIKLDYGDSSISRSNHAAIAYDDEQNGFFLGHGGKTNIIRLNDRPVVSTEQLHHHDKIRIGETTLLFVALCGTSFQWGPDTDGSQDFG